MDILFIILFAMTLPVGIVCLTDPCNDNKLFACYNTILGIIVIALMAIYFDSVKPIDVYRGKTTLEITYKNGVPIDSVVVYK